jgi:hypothetical protein
MDQVMLHANKHIFELVTTIIFTDPKGSIATNNFAIWCLGNHPECNVYNPIRPTRQSYYCPRDISVALLSSFIWIISKNTGLRIQVVSEPATLVLELILPG